jgi:hypothetical protein
MQRGKSDHQDPPTLAGSALNSFPESALGQLQTLRASGALHFGHGLAPNQFADSPKPMIVKYGPYQYGQNEVSIRITREPMRYRGTANQPGAEVTGI